MSKCGISMQNPSIAERALNPLIHHAHHVAPSQHTFVSGQRERGAQL